MSSWLPEARTGLIRPQTDTYYQFEPLRLDNCFGLETKEADLGLLFKDERRNTVKSQYERFAWEYGSEVSDHRVVLIEMFYSNAYLRQFFMNIKLQII